MSPSYIINQSDNQNSLTNNSMSNVAVSIVEREEIINIPFKLTTNGQKFYLDLNLYIKLCELRPLINQLVLENFTLENYDVVMVGSPEGENGPAINTSSNRTIKNYLSSNCNYFPAFYIRPNNLQIINNLQSTDPPRPNYFSALLDNMIENDRINSFECAICFCTRRQRNSRLLTCGHRYCIDCINRWMNSNEANHSRNRCPICRERIN